MKNEYQDIIILKTLNLIGGKLLPSCKYVNSDFTLSTISPSKPQPMLLPLIVVSKYAMILMNDTPIIIL